MKSLILRVTVCACSLLASLTGKEMAWADEAFRVEGYLAGYRFRPKRRFGTSTPIDLYPYDPWVYARNSAAPLPKGTPPSRKIPFTHSPPTSLPKLDTPLYYGDIAPGQCWKNKLTDIHLFSVYPDSNREGKVDFSPLQGQVMARFRAIQYIVKSKAHLVVSGNSSRFVPVLEDPTNRERFMETLVDFVEKNGFSGITFDWEFPKTDEEKYMYISLLRDLREKTQPKEITQTLALWPYATFPGDPDYFYEGFDYLHIMAYAFIGGYPSLERFVWSTERFVDKLEVPASKVIVGLPFYGRLIESKTPEQRRRAVYYHELVREFFPLPRWKNEESPWSFNGPDLVEKKVSYAKRKGVRGVVIWELYQDTAGPLSLLKAIDEEAQREKLPSESGSS